MALVLPHAEVPLHVVPGVPQLSGGKVADLTHEGFGACRAKCEESFISKSVCVAGQRFSQDGKNPRQRSS